MSKKPLPTLTEKSKPSDMRLFAMQVIDAIEVLKNVYIKEIEIDETL